MEQQGGRFRLLRQRRWGPIRRAPPTRLRRATDGQRPGSRHSRPSVGAAGEGRPSLRGQASRVGHTESPVGAFTPFLLETPGKCRRVSQQLWVILR